MPRVETKKCNFTTPGHGKSVADGTGDTVKSSCDREVSNGKDVISVVNILQVISSQENSKIQMFLIEEDHTKKLEKSIPFCNLIPIPKTQSIYQLIWSK